MCLGDFIATEGPFAQNCAGFRYDSFWRDVVWFGLFRWVGLVLVAKTIAI